MKKYIYIIGIIFIFFLTISTVSTYNSYTELSNKYSVSVSNEKAFLLKNDSLKNEVRALSLSVGELEMTNDSLIRSLNTARKKLKIKDEELKALYNIQNTITTTDTLFIKDTIFVDKNMKIDTILGNKWYKVNLQLQYPNIIKHSATYKSDLNVFLYTKKETINPPNKCFIVRWFQKKHIVNRVEVIDNNPHSELKNQTFILIDK